MRTRPPQNGRLATSLLLAMLLSGSLHAADWPQWRGANGDGISPETSGFPDAWPPRRLWQANVGVGCTSPVVAGGKLYVLGYYGPKDGQGTDRLTCFAATTGETLWQQSYPARYQSRLRTGDTGAYGGPLASPAFDAATGYLYTLGVDGELRCWDTGRKGRTVWRMNLHDRFAIEQRPNVGGGRRDFGFTSAPLIHGDALVVEVGSKEGALVAFAKDTGQKLWTSAYRGPAGHTGAIVPCKTRNETCLAFLALRELVLVRTVAGHPGETLGTYGRVTEFGCNIPAPVPYGTSLLLTSAYNHKSSELVAFAGNTPQRLWQTKDHALVNTPVIHGDRAYLIAGQLRCIDLKTGKRIWSGGSFGHGTCLLAADNTLIVHGNRRLALVDADPEATSYHELARVDGVGSDLCYPQVILADGLLVAKDKAGALAVFDLRRKAGKATRAGVKADRQLGKAWPGTREGTVFLCPDTDPKSPAFLMPRDAATVLDGGVLDLTDGAFLVEGKDDELLAACRKSNALAIEATITPANLQQGGPARILSFSQDPMNRNFTLGQEKDQLILRLRTPKTGDNGSNPQTVLCRLGDTKPHHLVISYSTGRLTCYVDGKRVLDTDRVQGDFSNWQPMHLILGDEYEDDRDWDGQVRRIAILSRPIGGEEAKSRFRLSRD